MVISSSYINIANSIISTSDGGYAAAGFTEANGDDFYIVKLDSTGSLQWTRTVGGTNVEYAYSIIQTTDGGYAIAGFTFSFGGVYIVKLDSNGSFEWNKTIGESGADRALSIIQSTDGGYVAAGFTESFGIGNRNMYIIKLDASGSYEWNKTIGGSGFDEATSVIQTADGGYAVAGYTTSFGANDEDYLIVKLNSCGWLEWSKTFGRIDHNYATSIIQTSDGGFAVAGYNTRYCYTTVFSIVKLSEDGLFEWSKIVGKPNTYLETCSIVQTKDGGYAVGGNDIGNNYMYIIKLDSIGSMQWDKTLDGKIAVQAFSMTQAIDGGWVLAGLLEGVAALNGMLIVKLDSNGNTCGITINTSGTVSNSYPKVTSPSPTVTSPTPLVTTPVPIVSSGGTLTAVCTTAGINNRQNKIPSEFKLYQNYPNPFNPTTKLKFSIPNIPLSRGLPAERSQAGVDAESGRGVLTLLKIYNILGQEVATLVNQNLSAGTYEVQWNGSNFASGVYFYKIKAGDFVSVKKMVLLK